MANGLGTLQLLLLALAPTPTPGLAVVVRLPLTRFKLAVPAATSFFLEIPAFDCRTIWLPFLFEAGCGCGGCIDAVLVVVVVA